MPDGVVGQLRCTVVTPEGKLADHEADFVVLTAHDGQFGILPERAPLLCKLGPGLLRIDRKGASHHYYVRGGFAEVFDNDVTVVTTTAVAAESINPQDLHQEIGEAQAMPVETSDQREAREAALAAAHAKESVYRLHLRKHA